QIENGDTRALRGTVLAAGDVHETGHRLDQQVITRHVGTALKAETGDGGVYQVRPATRHGLRIQTVLGQTARLEILHEDIGAVDDVIGGLKVRRVLQIQHHRILVAVDREVVGAHPVARRGDPGAGVIAVGGFHLDHGGAQIREQHGAVGSGEHAGEVCNDYALEG